MELVENKKIRDVLEKVESICKYNNVSHLYLFGSYAKKTERKGSDLDIVVKGVKDINKLKDLSWQKKSMRRLLIVIF